MNREKCTAVVLAAGKGSRMGTKIQKQYLEICGKPVLYYSLAAFAASPIIDEIVLVTGEGKTDYCRKNIIEAYGITKVNKIVVGGKERYDRAFFSHYPRVVGRGTGFGRFYGSLEMVGPVHCCP